jgi:type IV secretory pathway component VirB8
MTWDYYNEIQPIKKNLPIRVEISDAAEEYTKITYLGNKSKNFNINKVLIRYFSARFVEAIETYDYRDNFKLLTKNANVISKLGTQALQNYYQDKTSIRNSDSMVLKYRRNVIREVSVDKDKIEIAPLEDNGDFYNKKYLVTVNYAVREIYKQERAEVTYWQAKLKLNFETIHYNFEEGDFNDLNFRVYEYETNKVK